MAAKQRVIAPQPGAQTEFFQSPADIVFYGGGAGGGKTFALLIEPLRYIHVPHFRAGLFRKLRPQITMDGGLWDEAAQLYDGLPNAYPHQGLLRYNFQPPDSRISFNGIQDEVAKRRYDGAQFALVGWDQLEEQPASIFWYMQSRNRTTCGVRPYTRATLNPEPDSWLSKFLEWWIGPDGYIIKSRSGKIRHLARIGGDIVWGDTPEEITSNFPDARPLSFTFILGNVYENTALMEANPDYINNLKAQHPLEYLRLHGEGEGQNNRGGNWNARPDRGLLFNRDWYLINATGPPVELTRNILYFDFAATESDLEGMDESAKRRPSATAHMLTSSYRGHYFIRDWGTGYYYGNFYDQVKAIAAQASRFCKGNLHIRWEREPGSASKREEMRLRGMFMQHAVSAMGVIVRQDKVKRAMPAANAAHKGHYTVTTENQDPEAVDALLQYLHNQPQQDKDLMDALSGAHTAHMRGA